MERLVGVAPNKSPNRGNFKAKKKKKKQPIIKVVYIPNPIRVWTSESEFLALVQKLTGRHSDVAENMEMIESVPKELNSESINFVKHEEQAVCAAPCVLDRGGVAMYESVMLNPFVGVLEDRDQFSAWMLESIPIFMSKLEQV